jgi:hypothetical protein
VQIGRPGTFFQVENSAGVVGEMGKRRDVSIETANTSQRQHFSATGAPTARSGGSVKYQPTQVRAQRRGVVIVSLVSHSLGGRTNDAPVRREACARFARFCG